MMDDDSNLEGNRKLVFSIINHALSDAMSIVKENDPEGARKFIDGKNLLFRFYCELVDYNPDWLADKLKKLIMNWDNNKRMKSPYLFSFIK